MSYILEIKEKRGKKIYLSKERWKHMQKHPYIPEQLENIKSAIQNPTTIRYNEDDENVLHYYKEFKNNNPEEKYLLISVKYLNGSGFIITAFFTNKITGLKWKI